MQSYHKLAQFLRRLVFDTAAIFHLFVNFVPKRDARISLKYFYVTKYILKKLGSFVEGRSQSSLKNITTK